MQYADLLKHPRWQRKRLEIFNRDEWKCTKCSDTETNLQVHHLYYRSDTDPWDYPNDVFLTLCDTCHRKVEFIKWLRKYGIRQLIQQGFFRSDVMEIKQMIERRIDENKHRESVLRYMDALKNLING